ncbi:MAG: hypothetical protein KDA61_19255 [Planctomycetales bacterium]|nr:hypothetical protein [Planctomycetales bacterium]
MRGRANVGCDFDDSCYSCSNDVCCGDGCGDGCGNCQDGRCRLVDKIAGGFCGCGPGGCGLGGCAAGCNPHAGGYPEATSFNGGGPVGQVAYPYYTVRGPRDFLMSNPPTIGPR